MSFILHAMTMHSTVAGRFAVRRASQVLASMEIPARLMPNPQHTTTPQPSVPNPPAQAPPAQLVAAIDTVLGWGKWLVMASGVAGLFICGGKMTIGHRNRASFAADGATGIPWVLAGLSVAAVAAAIVGVFL
jgi:hypothetical protein